MTSNTLKIDFFGEGNGETIFLELPNGKIGIVDCGNKIFIDWFKQYIITNNITEIDFIVWTHPHADHTSYFPSLLDLCKENNIKITHFMRFGIRKFTVISNLIEEQCQKEYINSDIKILSDVDEAILAEEFKPSCLKRTIDKVRSLKNDGLIININNSLCYGQSLFSKNSLHKDIEIFCLAPTDEDIETYYQQARKLADKSLTSSTFCLSSSLHNVISVALCVKYGEASIVLGGDVLERAWQSVLDNNRHTYYSHNQLNLIKIPHHGSETAYLEDIWNIWGKDIYSVICPLAKYPLPKISDLENFIKHTSKIFILKDKRINTLLDFITQKAIGVRENRSSSSVHNTSHITFEISTSGEIKHEWKHDVM